MERMQNEDNGGAQIFVIWKYFLHVNDFRHADILHVNEYSVLKIVQWTLSCFCRCSFILKYNFSILNGKKYKQQW